MSGSVKFYQMLILQARGILSLLGTDVSDKVRTPGELILPVWIHFIPKRLRQKSNKRVCVGKKGEGDAAAPEGTRGWVHHALSSLAPCLSVLVLPVKGRVVSTWSPSPTFAAVPSNPQSGDSLRIISKYFLLLWALKKNGKSVEITLRLVEISTSQVVLVVKNPPANAGDARDAGSVPGSGRSSGGGHSSPLQYSCLENPHGQRNLAGYSPWGPGVGQDWVTKQSTEHTYIWLPRRLSEKESAYQ